MKYMDDEEEKNPEVASLQELMDAMSAMQAKRLPKKNGGMSITIAADPMSAVRPGEMGEEENPDPMSAVREGEIPEGIDPRLAEIIRRKKMAGGM